MSAAALVVCPLSRLAETLASSRARSVVTLLARSQRQDLPAFEGLAHLALDLSDIVTPRAGHVPPGANHVAALLDFARRWDRRAPLLLHCYAGVSRSTAAAFAVSCALQPGRPERDIAAELRAAAPSATPNPRLVALADAALGRRGRMVSAISAIGRGTDCFEGEVFRLAVPSAVGPGQMPAYQL